MGVEAAGILRSHVQLAAGMNPCRFPDDCLHVALVIPCFFGALDGNTAGHGSAYNGALHLVIRSSGHSHILRRCDIRTFAGLRLGQGICGHYAHRRAGCRGAGTGIGSNVCDREFVICRYVDRLRLDHRTAADHGKGPLLAQFRCITLESGREFILHAGNGIAVIGSQCVPGLGFVDFLFRPGVQGRCPGILAGLTGEHGLVASTLGAAEIVNGNTAGESKSAHCRRDGIGGNSFHVILGVDRERAVSMDFIVISQIRIGLGLHIAHVHRRA